MTVSSYKIDKEIPLEISCRELHEILQNRDDTIVVDVRTKEEIEIARFKGAKHIPLHALLESADDLPRDKNIVLICHHGVRSLQGCCCLRQYGLKRIRSLCGGLHAWSNEIDSSIPIYG